ncbi:hypothetical protein PLESTB_000113300 [Pleodorina starrii]|uniref:Uncharacterized protein n=1 Tax=Pleodorina starrii TaxID=330485 RepID=A0A9W6BB64_9CHLO|nr:hypothetical protein PLESTM_000109000 [Pleodorina starrii]GLC48580.1 hypothetical protein PLESTB_000113300 [Pleodorina starrii]GLC71901.1 hypothetical protein PLESTF_001179000 [Pleodorina starrii]
MAWWNVWGDRCSSPVVVYACKVAAVRSVRSRVLLRTATRTYLSSAALPSLESSRHDEQNSCRLPVAARWECPGVAAGRGSGDTVVRASSCRRCCSRSKYRSKRNVRV